MLGVSSDTQAAHARFKGSTASRSRSSPTRKDRGRGVRRDEGGSNSFERSTFVIDADGNVARIMRRVKPDEHAEQVLAALAGWRLTVQALL